MPFQLISQLELRAEYFLVHFRASCQGSDTYCEADCYLYPFRTELSARTLVTHFRVNLPCCSLLPTLIR